MCLHGSHSLPMMLPTVVVLGNQLTLTSINTPDMGMMSEIEVFRQLRLKSYSLPFRTIELLFFP